MMGATPTDESLMRAAIALADEAVYCGEAPIACVLWDGQRIVARGWNQRRSTGDITRHAEMVAFAALAQPGLPQPRGLALACTLEPCVMCFGACLELGVRRIVFGLEAPSNGGTARVADGRRPAIVGGIERAACRDRFANWLTEHPDHAGHTFVERLLRETA